MAPTPLTARFVEAMSDINPTQWDRLAPARAPHLQHAFLLAAELSGSVSEDTGWAPCHLLIERGEQLVGAMPLYQKSHSWGEFVFDWSWADAYRRAGLEYYPKLISAAPFTPATGSKLLVDADEDAGAVRQALIEASLQFARSQDFPSLHLQFLTTDDRASAEAAGLLIRRDCQFHWHNNDYANFDAFLATFRSKKRKNVNRERRRVFDAGIRHEIIPGHGLSDEDLEAAWRLCSYTFAARGHTPYLNPAFFFELRERAPGSLEVVMVRQHQRPVAAAILLRGSDTLYGRYWGSEADYHSLHFETCYYQGIDHCIREGIRVFEPGTQGEHKVARGFVPVETASAHWLAHPQFASAIEQYLDREALGVSQYMDHIENGLPYRDKPDAESL